MLPSVIIDHSLVHTFGGSPRHLCPGCGALQHRRRQRIQLFGELLLLPEEMQTRQWGAMSAPAPVRLQCQQKNCLSRAGSRYLHKAR